MAIVCTAEATRAAEQRWFDTHPGQDLMDVAAHAVAHQAQELLLGGAVSDMVPDWVATQCVLVLVGGGNNGGDGLFAAAALAQRGWRVELAQIMGQPHEAGMAAALAAGCIRVSLGEVTSHSYDLAIDAVLGIGGRPGIPQSLERIDAWLRDRRVPVLAVDVPSGLDANSGEVQSCVHAAHTMTFSSLKWCHIAHPAARCCGELEVHDIGLDLVDDHGETLEGVDEYCDLAEMSSLWPVPGMHDDKYSRGVVGVDTGSERFPGAAVLSVLGALRTGPGMVRFAGPTAIMAFILSRAPSVVIGEGRVQAWVLGSGWSAHDSNADRFIRRAADGVPMVIDADALSLLPAELPEGCLLTPHAGELARMLRIERSQVEADPRAAAVRAAQRFDTTVLVKGAIQWVARPDGTVRAALPGPAWTAQAGSGDVLAGMCGTLMAAGLDAADAALCAASMQAATAISMPGPYAPDQIAELLPGVVTTVLGR
ncbi:NAD(P)H-hydrate epimerase [Cutibacterium sp. V947]|uniref:NAD(P)H-hydrate epimerase n=1 Tax=Cutibacterium sp. V947 TaxID=3446480 RepID=UPI003EE105C1